ASVRDPGLVKEVHERRRILGKPRRARPPIPLDAQVLKIDPGRGRKSICRHTSKRKNGSRPAAGTYSLFDPLTLPLFRDWPPSPPTRERGILCRHREGDQPAGGAVERVE